MLDRVSVLVGSAREKVGSGFTRLMKKLVFHAIHLFMVLLYIGMLSLYFVAIYYAKWYIVIAAVGPMMMLTLYIGWRMGLKDGITYSYRIIVKETNHTADGEQPGEKLPDEADTVRKHEPY